MKITRKDWESEFFNKEIYKLECDPNHLNSRELHKLINEIDFEILEYNLDVTHIDLSYHLELMGFLLVDSRMIFITQINRNEYGIDIPVPNNFNIRLYRNEDIKYLYQLTDEFLKWSNSFKSRYKNIYFFEKGDAERYFTTWISNTIADPHAIISVAEYKGDVIGYFIYKLSGTYQDLPLYKGILCSITRKFQGLKLHLVLQDYIFKSIPYDSFFVDNTTQLSNLPIIKNHIRSRRILKNAYLTFMLKKSDYLNRYKNVRF